jgi:transposase, IS30 family
MKLESISIPSIYRYIKKDRKNGGDLYKHLRIMPKVRRKRYKSDDYISERPTCINDRSEFGHWEGDTVMGKDRHQCILTLVERKTGLNRIAKLENRTSFNTNGAISMMILKEPHLFKSITFDNGTEFHGYKKLEEIFGITCYFANPHHPWERGCNENFNGLIRQYFPKEKALSYIGEKKLERISDKLNNRPRKRLDFKSPKEALYEALHLLV